jgi:CRP/FNR family transcriptional regulator, nitrogen oxide reductase regulator
MLRTLQAKPSPSLTETPELAIPVLAGLSPSETADVLGQGLTLAVSPKGRICSAGDKADHFFVVLRGQVKYSRMTAGGDEILIHLFTPGESFGFAALQSSPMSYLGNAEAMIATELVVWNHRQASQLCHRYPKVMMNALGIVIQMLGTLSDRHCSLFEGDATHRIARVLIDIGRRTGEVHPEGIDVRITNEHLGALADVSKFTASRVLSHWNKAGVITKERETVRIHFPESLIA